MADTSVEFTENLNNTGSVTYANDVVGVIAGLAAREVEGVASMSGGFSDEFAQMLGKKSHAKGVKVEIGTRETALDLFITAEFGVNVANVAKQVQEHVKKAIETMTGLLAVEVNVTITGITLPVEA